MTMTASKHRMRGVNRAVLVVLALALGACTATAPTAPAETTGASGVTVYGTVDAGVGRSGLAR